jgi:hypothetical protein
MKSKKKAVRRIAISISKERRKSVPLNDIEEKVEKIISTGVSESKAKEIVPNIIDSQKEDQNRDPESDEILIYDLPESLEDLFIDPR